LVEAQPTHMLLLPKLTTSDSLTTRLKLALQPPSARFFVFTARKSSLRHFMFKSAKAKQRSTSSITFLQSFDFKVALALTCFRALRKLPRLITNRDDFLRLPGRANLLLHSHAEMSHHLQHHFEGRLHLKMTRLAS